MHARVILPAALIAAFLLLASRPATAQPRPGSFGFGLMLGDPTGFTIKGSAGPRNAWDAGIGPSWFGSVRIHGDYLWAADVFNSRKVGLYFGLGAAIGFGRGNGVLYKGEKGVWYYYDNEHTTAIGLRGSVGINAMPFRSPVELFAEIAPVFGIAPANGIGWDTMIGIRYYP